MPRYNCPLFDYWGYCYLKKKKKTKKKKYSECLPFFYLLVLVLLAHFATVQACPIFSNALDVMSLDTALLPARRKTGLLTVHDFDGNMVSTDVKPFLKWLGLWRGALLRWAVFSADLGHESADYLAKHCFVVHMEKTLPIANMSSAERDQSVYSLYTHSLQPIKGCMMPDSEILDTISKITDNDCRKQLYLDFIINPPQFDSIRILVLAGVCYNTSSGKLSKVLPKYTVKVLTNVKDPRSRSLSTLLKLAYMDKFILSVAQGNVNECRCILSQANEDMS
ncbi:hypothetical protein B0H16DRAFT_1467465 [Mycena metata]|uniref:Uncharacterized protein n=1 Tax=Mycena metata TaxID=1033252 RepID=A0AAD7I3Y5_9AGAR|nr:hypothetical protein B0H16DRAFT_1467465 [Mycena metata]